MYTRRMTLAVVVALAAICAKHASAEGATDLKARFNYLSQHGNVQCSVQFENSIATMPSDAKLEGSCCAPMGTKPVIDSSWMGSRSIPTLLRCRLILQR
jgi:hypothetical protein